MTRTIDQMIASEVLCCMSSLVATLATSGIAFIPSHEHGPDIVDLSEQALELAAPVDDWEEAAIQAGWRFDPESERWTEDDTPTREGSAIAYERAQTLCECENIEPAAAEVYEHWAVTDWFADKLEAAGEKVDRDFAGLCVWARTTTGQQIAADGVVARIYAQTHTA